MIAAAGSGERLGAGGPKAFVEVAGRPMVEWSLAAFAAAESVGAVVVAVPAGEEGRLAGAEVKVVAGGQSRAQSVAAALEEVETDVVAVHDAARPLVTAELIDGLVAELESDADADGVIAAAPLTDTVKRASGATVEATESRDGLWAAQTPQVFRTAKLREVHSGDPQQVAAATDDAMLVEEAGGTVLVHPSPTTNLKVTAPEDLAVAALLLAERR